MILHAAWRPTRDTKGSSVRLLVEYRFDEHGYRVAVTDLRSIWEESMDPSAIVARAEDVVCCIDTVENRDRLYERLRDGLVNERGTDLSIVHNGRNDSLQIKLTAPLPRPLPKLEWRFDLNLAGAGAYAETICSPLIDKVYRQSEDVRALQAMLADKDHVIAKLLDRLESSGTDLASVFPGTAGVRVPKGSSRRQGLYRHVKGLEPFTEQGWSRSKGDVANLTCLEQAFEGLDDQQGGNVHNLLRIDHLSGDSPGDPIAPAGAPIPQEVKWEENFKTEKGTEVSETETDDGDFETQNIHGPPEYPHDISTPLAGPEPTHAHDIISAGCVDEELKDFADDSGLAEAVHEKKVKNRLGVIGKKKATAAEAEAAQDLGKTKRSSSTDDHEARRQPKHNKLGTLGGKRQNKEAGETTFGTSSGGPENERVSSSETTEQTAEHEHEDGASRGRRSSQKDVKDKAPVQKETSQERADRRRDELKRQLEAQSAAAAKKKRRF